MVIRLPKKSSKTKTNNQLNFNIMKKIIFISYFYLSGALYGQTSVNACGGESVGSNGGISFTIGQIDYVTASGTGGSLTQGVQQPFEIFTLGTDEIPDIKLEVSVYPNPTTDMLYIKNSNNELTFQFQLVDAAGKLIVASVEFIKEGEINMTSLQTSTYYLTIQTTTKQLKTFKIIKN